MKHAGTVEGLKIQISRYRQSIERLLCYAVAVKAAKKDEAAITELEATLKLLEEDS